MKALIVEDSFLVRQILKDSLSVLGGDCDVTVNGEEAIQAFEAALAKRKPYDLICMDIKMPLMDGNQALQKIREMERAHGIASHKEVKVIMITACDDPKTVVEAYYRGGATSYLTKPFDAEMLRKEVQKLGLWP